MAYVPRLMYAYFDKDIVPGECSSVAARIKYRITVLYFQAIITSLNTFDGLAKDSSCLRIKYCVGKHNPIPHRIVQDRLEWRETGDTRTQIELPASLLIYPNLPIAI